MHPESLQTGCRSGERLITGRQRSASDQNHVSWYQHITQSLLTEISRSLHSTKSPLPLEITENLMRKILTRYQVDPAFLSVLFSFGELPHLAESGSSNIASTVSSDGSRSMVTFSVQSQSVLTSHKISRTRFDTLKRITDHRTGPGLSGRRVSTITTLPRAISTFSYCFTRSRIVFSSSKWPVLP